MGLNDRDYWREVPEYLRITGRGGGGTDGTRPSMAARGGAPHPPKRTGSAAAVRPGFVWAIAILTVLVLGGGLVAYLNPVQGTAPNVEIPSLRAATIPRAPAPRQRHVEPISGTRLLSYGGTLILSGRASAASGSVRVLGRWNSGPWETFAVADASEGSYRFVFPLKQRGTLNVKVVQPTGDEAVATYHVS